MTSQSETEPEYDRCEKCEHETPDEGLNTVTLLDDWTLCDACVELLDESMETHYWYDRYSKEQHERAVSLLEEQDSVWCVDAVYEAGEIIVHTPYVSSEVVSDVADHFGLRVGGFGPAWEEDENALDCVKEHGSCFEILLEYTQNSPDPLPLEADLIHIDLKWLDENDKQFEKATETLK